MKLKNKKCQIHQRYELCVIEVKRKISINDVMVTIATKSPLEGSEQKEPKHILGVPFFTSTQVHPSHSIDLNLLAP